MITSYINRFLNKFKQECYRLLHPKLWGHGLQLNGIPKIYAYDKLVIGKNVSLNTSVVIQCSGGVKIGDRVTLSRDVLVLTVGLESSNYLQNTLKEYREHELKSVTICDGVWIGARVTVCPGAFIAKNCIIAAGAVVSGRLETEGAVYGGVPAKLIKML